MAILFSTFLQSKLNRPKKRGGTYWGKLVSLVDMYDACPSEWVRTLDTGKIRRQHSWINPNP